MRKHLIRIIILIAVISLAVYVFVLKPTSTSAAWYDLGWDYRKSITLSRATGTVANYQMKVLVGESSGSGTNDVNCDSHCKTDFADLRFTNSSGTTLLDYWIESTSGTTPNQVATVWVEFDSIGTTATTFYMYYGNASAAAAANGANTFLFFDDFNDLSNFGTTWGSPSCSNGILTVPSSSGVIGTIDTWGTNIRIRAKGIMDAYSQYIQVLVLYKDGNNYTNICATDPVYFYYSQVPGNADSAWPGLNYETSNWHTYEIKRNASVDIRSSIDDANQGIMSTYPYTGTGAIDMSVGTGGQMRYDWVFIAQWLVTEPTWGSWGSGESAPTSTSNLQKGLVGWWEMNGNAKDSTPNNNHGTVIGATLTTDRKGQNNKAYSFNGSSNYINAGSNDSVKLKESGFSVSAWIYSLTAENTTAGTRSGIYSGGTGTWWIAIYSNKIIIQILSSPYTAISSGSNTIQNENWYHIVVTSQGSEKKFYINGVLKSTGSLSVPDSTMALIGRYSLSGSDYFNGSMDDVKIYNRTLSQTEIIALYEEYDPGIVVSDLQKGLVGQWKMNGNAKDSVYGNHGTVTGATLTTDRKGQVNKAYNFNGTNNYILVNNSASLNNLSQLTIDAWIKPDLGYGETAPRIWAKGNSFRGWINPSNGIFSADIHDNSGDYAGSVYSTGPISTNSWTHVMVVLDSTPKLNLYINGVFNASGATLTSPTTLTDNLYFGNASPNGTRQFRGLMDNIRIYNRALSVTEVTALYEEYDSGIVISDLQKGLVGQWKMNSNAKDSISSNHGAVSGATLTTDRKGQMNKAYNFNGTSNFIQVSDASNFAITDKITLGAWVYPTGWNNSHENSIVTKATDASYGVWNLHYKTTTYGFRFEAVIDGVRKTLFEVQPSTALNTWYHVVGVYDGANILLYVNGKLSNSTPASGSIGTNTEPLRIGKQFWFGSDYSLWQGRIDDVRIYNRALFATEVTALYESY